MRTKKKLTPLEIVEREIDNDKIIYKTCNDEFKVYDTRDEIKAKRFSLTSLLLWSNWNAIILINTLDVLKPFIQNGKGSIFILVIQILFHIMGFTIICSRVLLFDGIRAGNTIKVDCLALTVNPKCIWNNIVNPESNDFEEFSEYAKKFIWKFEKHRKIFTLPVTTSDGVVMIIMSKKDYRYLTIYNRYLVFKKSVSDMLFDYVNSSKEIESLFNDLQKYYGEMEKENFSNKVAEAIDNGTLESLCEKIGVNVITATGIAFMTKSLNLMKSYTESNIDSDTFHNELDKLQNDISDYLKKHIIKEESKEVEVEEDKKTETIDIGDN